MAPPFLVLRTGEVLRVMELPEGSPIEVPYQDGDDERIVRFRWDGTRTTATIPAGARALRNGKSTRGTFALTSGDALDLGATRAYFGTPARVASSRRRILTHGEFRERLHEELARSDRAARPTTLAMVRARSAEASSVAQLATKHLRVGDLIATYGPDELELLLPDTDVETAARVLDRILDGARDVHVGLAEGPSFGRTPERLERASRDALAEAASRGARLFIQDSLKAVHAPEISAVDPSSSALLRAFEQFDASARAALFVGEPGSGKTAFAHALHGSRWSETRYVTVDCHSARSGDVDMLAESLDDAPAQCWLLEGLATLSHAAQLRVARAMEENAHLRIVGTSDRSLEQLVERGTLVSGLAAHFDGAVFSVPPLRARPRDILILAERFAREASGRGPTEYSPAAVVRLRSYAWPGNALELKNAMERAVLLAGQGEILPEHLPTDAMPSVEDGNRLRAHVGNVERDAIVKALADCNHNQTHAAKRLGMSRRSLIYKLEKYGLKPPPRQSR